MKIWTGILGKYGDILLFTAVIRHLKKLYPNSYITFAISEKYKALRSVLERDPNIDDVYITKYYFDKFPPALYKAYHDAYFHLYRDVDWRGTAEKEAQSNYNTVFETRPRHPQLKIVGPHAVWNQTLNAGITPDGLTDFQVKLTSVYTIKEIKNKYNLNDYIVIHCSPNTPERTWPINNWNLVFDYIKNQGIQAVTIDTIKEDFPDPIINLTGQLNIEELIGVISGCSLFIGGSSAPLIIASGFEKPTVGIINEFGSPTLSAKVDYIPINKNAKYLRFPNMSDITPEMVIDEIKKKLGSIN